MLGRVSPNRFLDGPSLYVHHISAPMKTRFIFSLGLINFGLFLCAAEPPNPTQAGSESDFQVIADQFADIQVLRYRVPEFDHLSLQQKKLAYYLTEAGLA